jgi:diadenosine tetraphosphate (Ap4A) HIT family hydrolase
MATSTSNPDPKPCTFCKVPSNRIVESGEHAFVVLDAYPVSPGHSLVVSRRHVADVFELDPAEIGEMIWLIKSTRERLDRSYQPAGYNVGVNVGIHAGQTVMHVHIHVIPRYAGDSEDPTGGVRGVIPAKMQYPRPD